MWVLLQPAPNAAELAELAALFDKTEKIVEGFEAELAQSGRELLPPV